MRRGSHHINADGYKAVIDSGTSVLVGPQPLVKQILDGIVVKPDCSNLSDLPNIAFKIDELEYSFTPEEYTLKISEGGQTECIVAVMG